MFSGSMLGSLTVHSGFIRSSFKVHSEFKDRGSGFGRATAPERALARVCRGAGARVRCNARLRDMNVVVAAHDDRAIEVLATGLPLFFGAQLAVDITLRCTLATDGTAHPGAARVGGAVCTGAREDKETKYSELLRGHRCRLVVVALETGGRWSVRGELGCRQGPVRGWGSGFGVRVFGVWDKNRKRKKRRRAKRMKSKTKEEESMKTRSNMTDHSQKPTLKP